MEHNCALMDGQMKFRYRAAGVIIKDEKVLEITSDEAGYYYSVGGAVHLGEKSEDAAVREIFEETGIRCEAERLLFVHENFFYENGFKNHEVTLYYLMKIIDDQHLVENSNSCGYVEHISWIPIKDLSQYKVYPTFFADKLVKIPSSIEHIITEETKF